MVDWSQVCHLRCCALPAEPTSVLAGGPRSNDLPSSSSLGADGAAHTTVGGHPTAADGVPRSGGGRRCRSCQPLRALSAVTSGPAAFAPRSVGRSARRSQRGRDSRRWSSVAGSSDHLIRWRLECLQCDECEPEDLLFVRRPGETFRPPRNLRRDARLRHIAGGVAWSALAA